MEQDLEPRRLPIEVLESNIDKMAKRRFVPIGDERAERDVVFERSEPEFGNTGFCLLGGGFLASGGERRGLWIVLEGDSFASRNLLSRWLEGAIDDIGASFADGRYLGEELWYGKPSSVPSIRSRA